MRRFSPPFTTIIYLQDLPNTVVLARYVATSKNRVWVDDELHRDPGVNVFGRDRETTNSPTMTLTGLVTIVPEKNLEP